jgi:hypothetical protein
VAEQVCERVRERDDLRQGAFRSERQAELAGGRVVGDAAVALAQLAQVLRRRARQAMLQVEGSAAAIDEARWLTRSGE